MARPGCIRVALVLVVTGSGCVEPFRGSHIEFTLEAAHIPSDPVNGFGQPPSNTHYEMWVTTAGYAYKLKDFQVVSVIDRSHPCFIEDDESPFPGLHSTMYFEKWREVVNPQPGQVVTDLADAQLRIANMASLEEELKAIVSHDPTVTPETLAELRERLAAAGAAPEAISDEANAARKAICDAFRNGDGSHPGHPFHYVGNDKTFTLPFMGIFYGMVNGRDPRNGAFKDGAGFDVDATFPEFDVLMINWQFNDPEDGRLVPKGGAYPPSAVGYHYMSGVPQHRTRGVINVPMRHQDFSTLSGEAAIFPGLDDDNVNF